MDQQDMSDEEFKLYRLRECAARIYRAEGFPDYALRVERGIADHCQGMRIARFFLG